MRIKKKKFEKEWYNLIVYNKKVINITINF